MENWPIVKSPFEFEGGHLVHNYSKCFFGLFSPNFFFLYFLSRKKFEKKKGPQIYSKLMKKRQKKKVTPLRKKNSALFRKIRKEKFCHKKKGGDSTIFQENPTNLSLGFDVSISYFRFQNRSKSSNRQRQFFFPGNLFYIYVFVV